MYKCPECNGSSMVLDSEDFYKVSDTLVKCVHTMYCPDCGNLKPEEEIFDPKDEDLTMEQLFPNEGASDNDDGS